MDNRFAHRLSCRSLTRRDFIWLLSLSSTAMLLPACAVDPVTGKKQLVLMSEAEEIALDRQHAPQQFSMDYGPSQDVGLNTYLTEVGQAVTAHSHRQQMPYSFRAVNAAYVNAYAFPGGSIAATRGILVELENEAELAALLGHEIGHVNARHTAERMTKGTLVQLALVGAGAYVRSGEYANYAPYLDQIGGVGASMLLASYSRTDEREADRLGMEYMVGAGYNPRGMEGLMSLLVDKSKHKPSALELMFSTHPMSQERYDAARQRSAADYGAQMNRSMGRERYMDNTAAVRRLKPALQDMQDGAGSMTAKKFSEAETSLASALKKAPGDYAALLMMAKCQMALNNKKAARRFADEARQVYPAEAQAVQVSGVVRLSQQDFEGAHADFEMFDRLMPGNDQMVFLKGVALDGMGKKEDAAREYVRFLKSSPEGGAAGHARQRLTDWGYIK